MRRNVLHQGAPRRRRGRHRRHLPRARAAPRERVGSLGLGHGVRARQPGREAAGATATAATAYQVLERTMKPVLVLLLIFGLAACGERSQEPQAGKRSYQGKRDTLPWDNGPMT